MNITARRKVLTGDKDEDLYFSKEDLDFALGKDPKEYGN